MNILKKYGKSLLFLIICLLVISLLFSLFNLMGLLNTTILDNLSMVIMIIIFGLIGYQYGKKALKNGYLEGLKIGICFIFFLILINTLFCYSRLGFERIIYYVVLILTSIFSSMIGINRKK